MLPRPHPLGLTPCHHGGCSGVCRRFLVSWLSVLPSWRLLRRLLQGSCPLLLTLPLCRLLKCLLHAVGDGGHLHHQTSLCPDPDYSPYSKPGLQVIGLVGSSRKRTLMLWQAVELSRIMDRPNLATLQIARKALEPPDDPLEQVGLGQVMSLYREIGWGPI